MTDELLAALGRRAREVRLERGWTLKEVAQRSGVSPRFLVQLEAGRLDEVFRSITLASDATGVA